MIRPHFRYSLLLASVAAVVSMAACSSTDPAGMPMPQLNYAHLQPITINANAVNTHAGAGRTEGNFVVDPLTAAQEYFKARFAPRGTNGTLEVTIEEASVTQTEKPSNNKVAKFFEVAGTDVYNVVLRVRIEHIDNGGNRAYGKVLTGRRVLNISEHASIAERERREMEGFETMFREMDKEVVHIVTEDMGLGRF